MGDPHDVVDGQSRRGLAVNGDGRAFVDPQEADLDHAGGVVTAYGHLSRFAAAVRSGQRVAQGQIIGYVGMTGLSSDDCQAAVRLSRPNRAW